jgi:hypothetical protein
VPSFLLVTKTQQVNFVGGQWIYLGEDYLDLCRWTKRIGSQRISYSQLLPSVFSELRNQFIQWTAKLGSEYGDSLDWWMTPLSGRNPMQTPIYLHICYMDILFKHLLKDIEGECLIVCEDWSLLRALERQLANSGFSVRRPMFWQFDFGLSKVISFARIGAMWCHAFIKMLYTWAIVRILLRHQRNQTISDSRVVIIHTCVDEASFGKDGTFVDRYFGELPGWIARQGYQVKTIPWLFNLKRSLVSAYSWLSKNPENFLIPELYLNPIDCFKAAFSLLRTGRVLQGSRYFKEYEVTHLMRRERLFNVSQARLMKFFLYIPFFERWKKSAGGCDVFIDMFENMPCERPMLRAIKKNSPQTLTVGYQHAPMPMELMGYSMTKSEWDAGIFPHRIITNGLANFDALSKSDYPAGSIFPGPAFRYSYLFQQKHAENNSGKDKTVITVLLPMDIPAAVELIQVVLTAAKTISGNGLKVALKAHPMLDKDKLMRSSGMSVLPKEWHWAVGSMQEQLSVTLIAIGMGTGALLDAAAASTPILCVGRELGFSFNPLQYLADKYSICSSVSPDMFIETLENLIQDHDRIKTHKLEALSEELTKGLGKPSEESFSNFVSR